MFVVYIDKEQVLNSYSIGPLLNKWYTFNMNEQICICGFIGFFHEYVRGAEIPPLQRGTPVISTQ